MEKKLGITKEDIGRKISIEEYNRTCREAVMEFTDVWENLTRRMGYWVNMDDPYITYDNKYIETLWYLLKQLFDKGLLYKGYTIQPYSPAAGTGLSTHELNQPGCYRDVKDTTCTAQFRIVRNERSEELFDGAEGELYFLAWTTTPVDAAVEYGAGRGTRHRVCTRQVPQPLYRCAADRHNGLGARADTLYQEDGGHIHRRRQDMARPRAGGCGVRAADRLDQAPQAMRSASSAATTFRWPTVRV